MRKGRGKEKGLRKGRGREKGLRKGPGREKGRVRGEVTRRVEGGVECREGSREWRG